MIGELKKELIAIEVIRTLYSQFEKFPEDAYLFVQDVDNEIIA